MGKYHYVCMKNRLAFQDDQHNYHETETKKETSKFAENLSMGSYQPTALAIKNVKFETSTIYVQGRFGERKKSFSNYYPFFMICEEKDNMLEDIITGKKYTKKDNSGSYYYDFVDSNKLVLCIVSDIPTSKVVEALKSLSKNDIERYKTGSDNLDKAVAYGYQLDQIRIRNEKKQNQDDESFIKNFKNKYGR